MTTQTLGAPVGVNPYRPWPARITSIIDLTPQEKLFELRLIDDEARAAFDFSSGQFVELSIFGVGEAPISISSAPSKQGFIELCIRNAGDVTGAMHKRQCGDIVGLRGPFGRGFPFEEMKGHDILLVAGGLGIAPLKSLINHIHDDRHEFGKVTILYGARTPDEILFRYQFEMWKHRDDFDLVLTVDRPDDEWTGEVGLVTRLFDNLDVDPMCTYGAICGPPVMYKYVIAEMRKKEMDVDKIYVSFERRMKCGIGKCGHCGVGHQYACIDGPVFNYWEAMNLQEAIYMAPRVVVLSLASDFGCQVQITNMEDHILDVLGLIDLSYWQLTSSGHMPVDYDVAIVEGAVTTDEHVALLKAARGTAGCGAIAIGSCAVIGGIPAMANLAGLEERYATVYGDGPAVAPGRRAPLPVDSVIDVDYHVPGCPIDRDEFMRVLSRALRGLRDHVPDMTMCASCKIAENICFYDSGVVCLGLVTRAGCDATCPSLGRPCTGCRGIAPDANLDSARTVLTKHGRDPIELDELLRVYNAAREVSA